MTIRYLSLHHGETPRIHKVGRENICNKKWNLFFFNFVCAGVSICVYLSVEVRVQLAETSSVENWTFHLFWDGGHLPSLSSHLIGVRASSCSAINQEGIVVQGFIREAATSDECHWHSPHSLTPEQVTGQGHCIGEVPADEAFLCSSTYLLQPLQNT